MTQSSFVSTGDGTQIFVKQWGPKTGHPRCSAMAGHSKATRSRTRCFSWLSTDTA
jgi:hypothetical protein